MAKPSSSVRDKFGVDYLITGSASSTALPSSGATGADTEKILAAFGNRVLSELDGRPEKQARLFDLVDQTGLKIETLLTITDKLSQLGLVQILENDKYGNHNLQLTEQGAELIHNG